LLEVGDRRVYQEPTLEALPARRARRRNSRNTTTAKNRLCVIGAIAVFFAFGVYYTSLSAAIASKGYQLEQLKSDISRLETSNERLELTLASMSSLDKVEKIAVEKLGMQKPVNKDAALVASVEPVDSKPQADAKKDAVDEEQQGLTLAFSNLGKALKNLFVPGSAQASSNNR